uniref:BRICHOS domain-containing protein n=1 Tax=Panagrolaimus sp. PS1159 TaxID=55785 RepID=A0AC35GNI2_9BILA
METGYYSQNPRVIHETFRVGGQLSSTDISELDSTMVSKHCNGKDVYQLVKASRTLDAPYFVRDKREALSQELQFSVLNGDNVEIERIIF